MFHRRAQPTEGVEALNARITGLEQEMIALRRGMTLLDAQFEELIEKAYRKWSRAKMEIVRDEGQAEKMKKMRKAENLSLDDVMQKAMQRTMEE